MYYADKWKTVRGDTVRVLSRLSEGVYEVIRAGRIEKIEESDLKEKVSED